MKRLLAVALAVVLTLAFPARFRIGSVTKVFTATIVLQPAAERRLSLDAPVQRYLPACCPRATPT